MPAALERRLRRGARRHHLKGERRRAYVYGTLARVKAARRRKRTRKGRS